MSRSYRDLRRAGSDHYAAVRASFQARKDTRRDRAAAFAALGYDESEGLAAQPLHGARASESVRNARW